MNKFAYLIVVGAVGCGVDALEVSETESALAKCPDPYECTVGNGGGTYTEEFGFAGIGPNEFMITRFVNHGTFVSIEGRYHKPGSPYWSVSDGTISYATYNGNIYNVESVSETGTTPTWQFTDGTPVIGQDIENMALVVELRDENTGNKQYTLAFQNYTYAKIRATVHVVNVQWKPTGTADPFTQYCLRAPDSKTGVADPDVVVFQQGIAVNAINANIMDRDNAFVTMSCRYGAIATTRMWGYTYRAGTSTADFFDAALHMKRASYCGDDAFYTSANTDIYVDDAQPINIDINMTLSNAEALWSPTGAVCVNMANRRHYAATYDGFGTFNNYCHLPSCPTYCNQVPTPIYCTTERLADRPVIVPNP